MGDGSSINFWVDKWLDHPVVDFLNILVDMHPYLKARVADFINHYTWQILVDMANRFPGLVQEIGKSVIPLSECEDQLVWSKSDDGVLSLKYAFLFLNPKRERLTRVLCCYGVNQFLLQSRFYYGGCCIRKWQ